MKKRSDLKIYGQGSSVGGQFKDVIIKGSGQIDGDVECLKYKVYGNGEVGGNINADVVKIKGHGVFEGDIKTKNLKLQGEMNIEGDLFTDEAKIMGNFKGKKDLNAELCEIEGGFEIEGLLNADILKVNMYWPSKVSEIGGTEIKIKNDDKLTFLGLKNVIIPHSNKKLLKVETIEADEVYLENTNAKVVRGNNIKIGPECTIDLVEYKESFKNDDNSIVSTHKQI